MCKTFEKTLGLLLNNNIFKVMLTAPENSELFFNLYSRTAIFDQSGILGFLKTMDGLKHVRLSTSWYPDRFQHGRQIACQCTFSKVGGGGNSSHWGMHSGRRLLFCAEGSRWDPRPKNTSDPMLEDIGRGSLRSG